MRVGYSGSRPPLTANIGLLRRLFTKIRPSSMSRSASTIRYALSGRTLANVVVSRIATE